MSHVTRSMSQTDASEIVRWSYAPPYDFYNMEDTEDSVNELLNGSYRVVEAADGQMIGFYCIGESAQVPAGHKFDAYQNSGKDMVDLGVGLRPDLTGRGQGTEFLAYILRDVTERRAEANIRLTVATFNQRAIKLYRRFGFRQEQQFEQGDIAFQTMKRETGRIVWLRRATSDDEPCLCEWLLSGPHY